METRCRYHPFYTPPACIVKTSAEIISEARAAMAEHRVNLPAGFPVRKPGTVRAVNTRRPFTPRDPSRSLGRLRSPATSLGRISFSDFEGCLPRLSGVGGGVSTAPMSASGVDTVRPHRTRLPAIVKSSVSLDNLPEEIEGDVAGETVATIRLIHSSPEERASSDAPRAHKTQGRVKVNVKPITEESDATGDEIKENVPKKKFFPAEATRKSGKSMNKFNQLAFAEPRKSPRSIMGMDKLMETTDNHINEARACVQANDTTVLPVSDSVQHRGPCKQVNDNTKPPRDCVQVHEDTRPPSVSVPANDPDLPTTQPAKSTLQVTDASKPGLQIDESMKSEGAHVQVNESHATPHIQATPPVIQASHSAQPLSSVEELISVLQTIRRQESNDSEIIKVLNQLYEALERENVPASKNNKLKAQILKTVYKFVDEADETLLLHIARIALILRVSGHNLSVVCKLIFKISRTDKNDKHFQDTNVLALFVEALGRASPLEDAEALVYGYGALKFLTMNNQLLQLTLQHGALDLMVLHVKIINNARLELLPLPEQTSHTLYQLTGALRNVASEEAVFPRLVITGAVTSLCRSMDLFAADLDLICNIARTLSIVSTNDLCCASIVSYQSSFATFTKVLSKFPGRQDIVVRLGYALGNIVAKCPDARLMLYEEPGALDAIIGLLESYLEKDLEMMSSSEDTDLVPSTPDLGSDGSVSDVIVKMIRIVANMCLHPAVGIGLTCSPSDDLYSFQHHASKEGGRFLDVLLTVLRRKSLTEHGELVLSALSTLNNLSFYADPDDQPTLRSPFAHRQLEIAQALSALLLTGHDECLTEVARVLGNLTRSKETRDYVLETGGIGQLVRCLSHDCRELVCAVAGVLVNMMADWDKRLAFKEDNGIVRLISAIARYGEQDWRLACLGCQALWNFCIDSSHLYAALGVIPTNQLMAVLVDLLDEERIFGVAGEGEVDEATAASAEYQQWEQFAAVATNLLEKIEQYLDSLQAFATP